MAYCQAYLRKPLPDNEINDTATHYWELCTSTDKILEWQGDLVMYDHRIGISDAILKMEAIEGRYLKTSSHGYERSKTFHVTQLPEAHDFRQAATYLQHLDELKIDRHCCTRHRQSPDFITAKRQRVEINPQIPDVVGFPIWDENGYTRETIVRLDHELYQAALTAYNKRKAKQELREKNRDNTPPIYHGDLKNVAEELAKAFPCPPNLGSFQITDFILYVIAHDAIKGIRATNKVIKPITTRLKAKPHLINGLIQVDGEIFKYFAARIGLVIPEKKKLHGLINTDTGSAIK